MRVLSFIFIFIFILCNLKKILSKKKKHIFFFDIDNTLCDTWKSLSTKKYKGLNYIKSERNRVANLEIFLNMKRKIYDLQNDSSNLVFFLSARNIYLYDITYYYLKFNKIVNSVSQCLLVRSPKDKVYILKFFLWISKKKITLYDDLSYNHEKGEILFYKSIIDEINGLKINYYGYKEILKINYNL